ncbi:acyl-CoA dehydrogenase family protein [Frankia sp. Cppng1_Ct_nod]|uniref:acyl-CoA dehydrogenase family protein n=1 Tax=Frankia sp. Cppng1_Ct_nod TaxID=2897162 RepID=UPI001041A443
MCRHDRLILPIPTVSTTSINEHQKLRKMVRALLTARCTEVDVRNHMMTQDGLDQRLYRKLGDLGLLELAVSERFGGAGFGLQEVGVVLEEAGRTPLCAPYLSSVGSTLHTCISSVPRRHNSSLGHLPNTGRRWRNGRV